MKDVPQYVVVIPQPDGSLYPIKFHSNYDEAVITANNHDKSSEVKSQIRSDGPEVWKAFEEREKQEKNKVSPGTKDELDKPREEKPVRRLISSEDIIKLVEFAEKLEKFEGHEDETLYCYQFIPNEQIRPYGLLFWGPPEARLFSVKIGDGEDAEQLVKGIEPVSIRQFLNPYISIEAVQYWVERKAKLQYTNLAFPAMKPGDKMQVLVDKPCTICVCGMKQEVSSGTKA